MVVVLLLAGGVVYWLVNAQTQRGAIAQLQQRLTETQDRAAAAEALAQERLDELERLRREERTGSVDTEP